MLYAEASESGNSLRRFVYILKNYGIFMIKAYLGSAVGGCRKIRLEETTRFNYIEIIKFQISQFY